MAEVAVFSHQDMLHHRPPEGDAERPARLTAVLDALVDADLCGELRQAERVSREDLLRVHSPAYLEALREVVPDRGVIQLDVNTAMSPGSLLAAERACGAVVQAVGAVVAGELQRAFCAVRPPGHHALPSGPMGFCLFSNLAVGAKVAQALGVERVAVVDFDVHHGNGTEAVFQGAPGCSSPRSTSSPCSRARARAAAAGRWSTPPSSRAPRVRPGGRPSPA